MAKKHDYRDRTEHGDPLPERVPGVLSPEELLGQPAVEPVRTGTRGFVRKCGQCGRVVPYEEITCQVCAPGVKASPLGGMNGRG